ncbi:MAG: ATP-binding cassette domain-containing protein [Alphaproteobacteria bacterium]|nr:ATP-binding cassette domain-containing protein [Alphaproteobacteria bacterium]
MAKEKKSLTNNVLLDISYLSYEVFQKDKGNKKIYLLEDIAFTLNFNQIIGVVGMQLAGKTLLANILAGLIRPTAGTVIFNGQDISPMNDEIFRNIRHDINIVPANCHNALNPYFTIGDNILLPLTRMKDSNGLEHRLQEVADRLNISDAMLKAYPDDMPVAYRTAGLYQLACLARALITRPKLLIIDDITTELNIIAQANIVGLLPTLSRQMGTAMIVMSRDARIMQPLCDNIIILDDGKIVEYVPTSQFIFKPKSKAGKFILENTLAL